MKLRNIVSTVAVVALSGLAVGCATEGPPPSQDLTMARTLVEQADKSDAQRYAAADLQRAHDELSSAEKAAAERRYTEARRYAEMAQVDADLASARASSGEAQRAAHEIQRSLDSLKQESDRHANQSGAG
jgi:Domain of unknown function (DUF4398)